MNSKDKDNKNIKNLLSVLKKIKIKYLPTFSSLRLKWTRIQKAWSPKKSMLELEAEKKLTYLMDMGAHNKENISKLQSINRPVVIPDMFIYEVCKPIDAVKNFKLRMKLNKPIEENIKVTREIGEIIQKEVKDKDFSSSIYDERITLELQSIILKIDSGISSDELSATYKKVRAEGQKIANIRHTPTATRNRSLKMINEIISNFSGEFTSYLRKTEFSIPCLLKFTDYANNIEAEMLKLFWGTDADNIPKDSVISCYFRYILIQQLQWVVDGGYENRKFDKFQNDNYDVSYAVTASLTNSILLSKDKNQLRTFINYELSFGDGKLSLTDLLETYKFFNLPLPPTFLEELDKFSQKLSSANA